MNIYEIGINNYWTGGISSVEHGAGTLVGWTRTTVPALGQNKFALWMGEWIVTSQAPTEVPTIVSQESLNDLFLINSTSNFIHTQRVIAQTVLRGQVL
jgi:hypothetical protein